MKNQKMVIIILISCLIGLIILSFIGGCLLAKMLIKIQSSNEDHSARVLISACILTPMPDSNNRTFDLDYRISSLAEICNDGINAMDLISEDDTNDLVKMKDTLEIFRLAIESLKTKTEPDTFRGFYDNAHRCYVSLEEVYVAKVNLANGGTYSPRDSDMAIEKAMYYLNKMVDIYNKGAIEGLTK